MSNQFVWVEKYRPLTVGECILPKSLKAIFNGFVKQGNLPNFTFIGPSGSGKTSVAKAIGNELNCDYITINGSLDGNIDTLRNKITSFASSVSFKGKRKLVILDEADYLTHATQPALRNFIETYSKNCGFILTANYHNNIIKELYSRCPEIDFSIPKEEQPVLMAQFYKVVINILEKEGVEYDKSAVAILIKKYFPDWRKTLTIFQKYAADCGKIDTGILTERSVSLVELIKFMKEKNFTEVRKWAAENVSSDYPRLYREFYDTANEYFKTSFVAELVLIVSKYMSQASMVFDQEINFVAFCVEVMMVAEWK